MREIKFRGKCIKGRKTGQFVYGDLLHFDGGETSIRTYDADGVYTLLYAVIPATVGQFTGLKDKNGVEVYEGDILFRNNAQFPMRGPVKYENGSFFFHDEELGFCWYPLHGIAKQGTGTLNDLEVIGNIHDTKEAV